MPRRKRPSRIRYEAEHPSLTVRIPGEVKAKIMATAQAEGLSVSEWVQAVAAGHATDAADAYARALAVGRLQGLTAQAIMDAAAAEGAGRTGAGAWTERAALGYARSADSATRRFLAEQLTGRPNLPERASVGRPTRPA